MHDFERDAQWATSQNPGLRLTGDNSLHECFGCHFIPAAFLFFRGTRKVVPVHDHLQLVVPGPAPAGVVVLAHNIRCQDVSLKPPDCYSGFALNWIFFHAVRHHSAELSATTFRQRSMFPVFFTRRHLFCRHSSLQHWSVRLALNG